MDDLDTSIEAQLQSKYPQWLTREFRIVETLYHPESFGDSLVVLESSQMRIQLRRDRGQVFGEIASPHDPDSWFDLSFIERILTERPQNIKMELQPVLEYLSANEVAIRNLLNEAAWTDTKAKLTQIQEDLYIEHFGPYIENEDD